jgi:hypothetical protein
VAATHGWWGAVHLAACFLTEVSRACMVLALSLLAPLGTTITEWRG